MKLEGVCLPTPKFSGDSLRACVLPVLFKRVCKVAKSDYKLRNVCPSVRKEQLGYQWTDIHKILYLIVCLKYVQKIQVELTL